MSACYEDPLERLLEIVLPQGGQVTVMMKAYFDESGCHDRSPILGPVRA